MNIYENIVILNASLGDEEIETASGKIKDLITNSGGEILKTDVGGAEGNSPMKSRSRKRLLSSPCL